jgi:hypothetical protein
MKAPDALEVTRRVITRHYTEVYGAKLKFKRLPNVCPFAGGLIKIEFIGIPRSSN